MGKKVTIVLDLENGQFVTKLAKSTAHLDQMTRAAKVLKTALTGAFSMVAGRQLISWTKELVGSFLEFSEKQAKATGKMNETAAQIIGMTKEWDRLKVAVGEGIAGAFVKAGAAIGASATNMKEFNDESSKLVSLKIEEYLLKIAGAMEVIYGVSEAISGVFRPIRGLFIDAPFKTAANADVTDPLGTFVSWFKNMGESMNPWKDWKNVAPSFGAGGETWAMGDQASGRALHEESLRVADKTIQRMRNQAASQPK